MIETLYQGRSGPGYRGTTVAGRGVNLLDRRPATGSIASEDRDRTGLAVADGV